MFPVKRQIHVRIVGGLGNQLFVYFAGRYLSQVSGRELVLDMREASRSHSLYDLRSFNEVSETKVARHLFPKNKLVKKILDSLKYRLPSISSFFGSLIGYFADQGIAMNELSLKSSRKIIKFSGSFQDFLYLDKLQNVKLTLNTSTLDSNLSESQGILAIHIRRGDFISQSLSHGCLSVRWYKEAISTLLSIHTDISRVRIFSNEDLWVRRNLAELCPNISIPVEIIKFDSQQDPAVSFISFANSPYRICSNSTFSLLASRLSPGVSVVPYPYNRSGDFKALEESSPKDWIRIPSIWEE